jgi:phosphoenolpyruvate carboxylase
VLRVPSRCHRLCLCHSLQLNIGSRPAARTSSARIEDLRAIPWVFAWGQCRVMLPGWYGFGSAVEGWLEAYPGGRDAGLALLQKMHQKWSFFRTTLMNMEMVLSKTDMTIASRYAGLVTEPSIREVSARNRHVFRAVYPLASMLLPAPRFARPSSRGSSRSTT